MKCILSFLLFVSFQAAAQTKLIAHKSHSGNTENFHRALDIFDMSGSNFGMAPERFVTTARLDSVILLSDSVAIMVTSETCDRPRRKSSTVWKAGKDTVYNHPLFNNKRPVKSIRQLVRHEYFFQNPADSIRFIGFQPEDSCAFDPGEVITYQNCKPVKDQGLALNFTFILGVSLACGMIILKRVG